MSKVGQKLPIEKLNIEEIRLARKELEQQILLKLQAFEEAYDVNVDVSVYKEYGLKDSLKVVCEVVL